MDDLLIIPAKKEDIPEIARVTAESWKAAYKGIIADEYLASVNPSRWNNLLNTAFENDSLRVMLAVKDEEIMGISAYGKSRNERYSDDGEIVSMYFLPACIGKGYGHQLMERVLIELSDLGHASVILSVLSGNQRALSFYKKWGFSVVESGLSHNYGGIDYKYQLLRRVGKG